MASSSTTGSNKPAPKPGSTPPPAATLAVLIILVAAVGGLWLLGKHLEHSDAAKAAKANQVAQAAAADISVVTARSYCMVEPELAQIWFVVELRNSGDTETGADLLPVRRYDDGSTNASVLDEFFDLKVGAHSTRTVYGKYNYKAVDHDLIECWARLNDDPTNDVPLKITLG